MEKKLHIVIGCDTDPDRPDFLDNVPENSLSWRGMLQGIPQMKERLKNIHDSAGKEPALTWCLRVDEQIRKIHGSYSYILDEHKDFLLDLEQSGGELAWHPHFWNYDEHSRTWYQECCDIGWQVTMLEEAHAAYQKALPGRARTVRMGWDYHNNQTFAALQRLGVKVDFSAIPGMKIDPKSKSQRSVNFFDWYYSPNHPYTPELSDYRREAAAGGESFTLFEAPNFVSESRIWGAIRGLALAKKMKSPLQLFYALVKPTYWINITGQPSLFAPITRQLEKNIKRQADTVFVTYFHPDELVENKHRLYSLENMAANISELLRVADKMQAAPVFTRAHDLPGVIEKITRLRQETLSESA